MTTTTAQMGELHADAIAIERSRRQRIVITRSEIQVGDILDFELVTDWELSISTNLETGNPIPEIRVCHGLEWTLAYGADETVSVHR